MIRKMKIPFNVPYITGKEMNYIEDAITKLQLCGDGDYSKRISKFMKNQFNIEKSFFLTSGSAALDMSAILLNLKKGDEVIMPSFTFVSTANSVVLRNANIKFVDIDPTTFNIDTEKIEENINENTKAIFPVHYGGISCNMDTILKLKKKYNLKIVEDAAQGVNAKYLDKYLGSIGDIGCYSFHATKNYICGEGGLILINNPDLGERAEIIREKGTDRTKFIRGEVDKYSWVDIGSSFLGSEILAAFLMAQLDELSKIQYMRKKIFLKYNEDLKILQERGVLKLPFVPNYSTPNYHIYYIVLKNEQQRNKLMIDLRNRGIQSVFHYIPLHSSKMGKKLGYKANELPITEEYSKRILRLPIYPDLKIDEVEYITSEIKRLLY